MALPHHVRAAMGLGVALKHGKLPTKEMRDARKAMEKFHLKHHGMTPREVDLLPENKEFRHREKLRIAANQAKNRALKNKMK